MKREDLFLYSQMLDTRRYPKPEESILHRHTHTHTSIVPSDSF
jgi:hypothetical protein